MSLRFGFLGIGCAFYPLFAQAPLAALPAFPSAEGFGKYATGGRGGEVYHVTTLNETGPGSITEALSKPGRTILFDVSGIIRVAERLIIPANTTLAGQTAPGDGITIYGNGVSYSNANNSITRFIRFRMGVNGTDGKDGITIAEGHDMIFDHVSVSWGRDENFSINGDVSNITLQYALIGQGLEPHSCGGLMQSDTGGISILRTLYIDNNTRNAKVKGTNQYVNNVVYNWDAAAYILGDSEGKSRAHITDSYFIQGPVTGAAPYTRANANFSLYATGNYYDANRNGLLDGVLSQQADYGPVTWQSRPFDFPKLAKTFSAREAYDSVAAYAGASLRRDTVDKRLIQELVSLGKLGQIITRETDAPMIGPGTLRSAAKPADTDGDGMPDAWERQRGLNTDNAGDRNGSSLSAEGYTNLEVYLQELAGDRAATTSLQKKSRRPARFQGRDGRIFIKEMMGYNADPGPDLQGRMLSPGPGN